MSENKRGTGWPERPRWLSSGYRRLTVHVFRLPPVDGALRGRSRRSLASEWSDLLVSQCARGVCSMAYCGKHRVCQEEIKKEGGADDRHQVTDAKCEAECGPSGPVSN